MSGVTGEIGFKIGAAGSELPGVGGKTINATPNQVALTVNGAPSQFALQVNGNPAPTAVSEGLLVQAGVSNNDVSSVITDVGGTHTLLRLLRSGNGQIGWNSSSLGLINFNNSGTIQFFGVPFQVLNGAGSTQYFSISSNGASISNIVAGNVQFAVNETAPGNLQQLAVAKPAVIIGTSAVQAWSTGASYPVLQFAAIGAIMGTATTGLVLMGGGLYYNGTNYIYGQAGTGIQATLGTGSFTVSCFNTSGTTAGTATPAVVFSIGGTVTSNQIQGYGPAAAALVDMTPDRWVGTATLAIAANTLATATVSRNGKVTSIWVPAITGSGNGNTTTMVLTVPMPAAFQNTGTLSFNLAIEAAGTSQIGLCNYSGTTFTLFPAVTGGTFTGTFNRGIVNGVLISWPTT